MAPSHDPTNDIYGPPGPPLAPVFPAEASGGGGGGAGSQTRMARAQRPANHGSRTITIDPTEAGEVSEDDGHVGILDLTGEPSTSRRVQWDDEVVDNEHLNKKKSKICCIFKKQKEFGESSDESSSESDSDSGSESDGGPSGSGHGKGKGNAKDKACNHDHDHDHSHGHGHGSKKASKPKKKVLNEYERMPKVKSAPPKPINQPDGPS